MFKCIMMIVIVSGMEAFSNGYSQTRINIDLQNISLKKALKEVENKSDYRFLYNDDAADFNKSVSLHAKDASITEVMTSLLLNSTLNYRLSPNNLVVISPVAESAVYPITGKVVDEKGVALIGVSVTVKGTTIGVSTDANGNYKLNVPDSKVTLVFKYLGYVAKEIAVEGQRTSLNVTLTEDLNSLEEVVVTGYGGTAKKSDLTGSTSSISAKQIQERQPINLFDALQGQAAGVLVVNDSGEPGAEGSIQIRGASTFSEAGNAPLYVIDGVISDNASGISPNDIQNVEVLKDAASSSIYGARAANGVILITTKRGQEGKPRLEVQYSHVFGKISHTIQQANSKDLRLYRKVQSSNPDGTSITTDSLNPAYNSDNYLEDMLLGNWAHKNDIKVGVSGGQKGLTYYSSINFLDDRGIALNTWYKRLQGRLNVDYQATPKFKYSANLTYMWSKQQQWIAGNSLKPVFDRSNNFRVYLPDGSLTSYVSSKRNPVANALLEKNETEAYKAQVSNTLEYKIFKDLKFTGVGNAQFDNSQLIYFKPAFISDNGARNEGKNAMDKKVYWQLQSFLNYNKTVAKDHTFTGLLGVSAERNRYDNFFDQSPQSTFTSEEIFVFKGNNFDVSKSYTDANASSLASLFGRIGYNYKSRYIVQGTFRRDGSARFGQGNKWGSFLSGSAAWRFSDEKFMSWSKSVLEDAKLRVSIGQQGNDGIPNYEMYSLVNFGEEVYGGIGGATVADKLGNSRIKWENTVQQDFGMDLSFLNGKLTFTTDYYIKQTNGLLADQQIARETGFTKVRVNVGSLRTNGMEFVLGGTPVTSRNFSWNITGNVSFEKGKILSLINHQPFISGSLHYIKEGGKIGDFYGYEQLGIYRWTASNAYTDDWVRLEPVNVAADGKTAEYYTLNGQRYNGNIHKLYGPSGVLKGGDTEWANVRKDSLIDDADRKIIGNATPDFYLGVINNFNYKRFSLSFIVNATVGGQIYNSFKENQLVNANTTGSALPEGIYSAWRREGDIATFPYYPNKDNNGNQKKGFNSYYLEDASFIRLSSARLNYSLAPSIAKRIFAKGISAYVYGVNLVTWTNYTGFDPEFSSGNPLQPGIDGGKYPKRRELGLGLNITL